MCYNSRKERANPVKKRIFLSPPFAGEAERKAVASAFDSGYLAPCGPQVDAFERRLASLAGVPEAAAVSSGTAALTLLSDELCISPRDTVFSSDLTFIASVSPFARAGAKLVLVDSSPLSGNIDLALLESAVEERSRTREAGERFVIVAVDLYGQCCDYDALEEIASRHDAILIVDSAESVGAFWKERPSGSAGTAAIYSFNGNKIITTSGGGAVLSRNAEIVRRARWRSQQSRENCAWYEHRELGRNFRLSNILGAFGIAQLDALPDILERKAKIRNFYLELFSGSDVVPFPRDPGTRANNWLSVFLYPDPKSRDDASARLSADNVESRPVWKPMHLQPVFADVPFVGSGVTENLFDRGLCLPSGAGLDNSDLSRIASSLTT